MIVTEEEARTKWCPHARVQVHQSAVNREMDYRDDLQPRCRVVPARGCLCVASNCMAWKWMRYHSPEELEARKAHGLAVEVPKGYCGL